MTGEVQQIMEKLDHIQSDLLFIRKRIVDVDLILTDDDTLTLNAAEVDLRNQKTVRIA